LFRLDCCDDLRRRSGSKKQVSQLLHCVVVGVGLTKPPGHEAPDGRPHPALQNAASEAAARARMIGAKSFMVVGCVMEMCGFSSMAKWDAY
jgi:hypothetical protein